MEILRLHMRYTEAKLSRLAEEMLLDIEKETVDWMPNYDATREEPTSAASEIAESVAEWDARHRGRHGDEHPAA